jgi:hypothetical protein
MYHFSAQNVRDPAVNVTSHNSAVNGVYVRVCHRLTYDIGVLTAGSNPQRMTCAHLIQDPTVIV